LRLSPSRSPRRPPAASITDMEQDDDGADALEKQVHAIAIAEAVIEFARMTIAANRALDSALILRCLLAETLAAMEFDCGLDAETAMRAIGPAVEFRVARREEAETPRPPSHHRCIESLLAQFDEEFYPPVPGTRLVSNAPAIGAEKAQLVDRVRMAKVLTNRAALLGAGEGPQLGVLRYRNLARLGAPRRPAGYERRERATCRDSIGCLSRIESRELLSVQGFGRDVALFGGGWAAHVPGHSTLPSLMTCPRTRSRTSSRDTRPACIPIQAHRA
jgi:hypothetical protein